MRLTLLGWLLIPVVATGAILAGVGPRSAQVPAFIVAAIAAGIVVSAGLDGGGRGIYGTKSTAERREEFGARPREQYVGTGAEAGEEAWQRERERRERDGRGA